jgi:hypothetical protein
MDIHQSGYDQCGDEARIGRKTGDGKGGKGGEREEGGQDGSQQWLGGLVECAHLSGSLGLQTIDATDTAAGCKGFTTISDSLHVNRRFTAPLKP